MARRLSFTFIGLSFIVLLSTSILHASNTSSEGPDYSRLLSYIEMRDLQDPLVAFGMAEEDFDRRLNQENIAFLNSDKALIQRIQSLLKGESLKWRLSASFKQILVVPENREEYAQLFESYCRAAVDYLLNRLHMPNPYARIATFRELPASIPDAIKPEGITVYLVHNLADEYIEEYLFFNPADEQIQIKIKLSNRQFDGKIGSYSSQLKIGENNHFEFIREPYTVWQNSAENPLNVLIVPIEETLHILMRPSTEAAMEADLVESRPTRLSDVQRVVDEWMAVEEAIVGGVVSQVMPDVLTRFVNLETATQLTGALDGRADFPQYRLLNPAIRVVTRMGVDQALAVYRNDPRYFKQQLSDPGPYTSSLSSPQSPQPHTLIN